MTTFDPADACIASDRLLQRRVEEGDLADLLLVNGNDAVTQYLPYQTWHTTADAQAWYARISGMQAEGKLIQLVIVERSSGRVIGASLLFNFDPASERAEVGYVLGEAHWGRGLMKEALVALLAFAFDALKMRRVEAFVDGRNLASDRLLRRLGFTCEGTMRQHSVLKGIVRDSMVYGLLRDEWQRTTE